MDAQMMMVRMGEVMLKGKNRSHFEQLIVNNMKEVLAPFPKIKLLKEYGRIYIELNGHEYDEAAEALKKVFGIISFSPVRKIALNMDRIQEIALQEIRRSPEAIRSFKIMARRVNKAFPYTSMDMNRSIGAFILKNSDLRVDVHKPDVAVQVEVRSKSAYIFSRIDAGAGGLPAGMSGKGMLMLSGGIDSPVAGWLAMRKGLTLEIVHFHSFPYTSERAQQKVIDLTRKLSRYVGTIYLHMVPFTEIQTELKRNIRENLLITVMRRAMFQITQKLAWKREGKAIVTGESLGQVASQTLSSIYTIEHGIELPLIRPLITMDKNEIIQIAQQIDTYDISIRPYEDCCTIFLPKSPATNPSLKVVEQIEVEQDWLAAAIAKAVDNTEMMMISNTQKEAVDELF